MVSIALYFFISAIVKKIKIPYLILLGSFLIQVTYIRYYRGELFYGYLKFLLPYIFIFVGTILYSLFKYKYTKIVGTVLLLLYIYTTMPASFRQMSPAGLVMETADLYNQITAKVGSGPFKLFKCKYSNEPKIEALSLLLHLYRKYDAKGKTLGYHWGCSYPAVIYNGEIITKNEIAKDKEMELKIFPHVNYAVKDFSIATEAALLAENWVEVTPLYIYQKSARWWMDEQP